MCKVAKVAVVLMGTFVGLACSAQMNSPEASVWAGEWREYRLEPAHGKTAALPLGEHISISDCAGIKCKVEIDTSDATGHYGTSSQGELAIMQGIASPSTAVAMLGGDKCTLKLSRTGTDAAQSITVARRTGDCSDYCTPGASFEHTYLLRSRSQFFGDSIERCYADPSPGQMAICNSKELADEQHEWLSLSLAVADLEGQRFDFTGGPAKFAAACDGAADAAACLKDAFARSMAELNQRKQAWLERENAAGTSDEAEPKIAAIQGFYRHTFMNGDVQGDSFKTTDRLLIAKLSDTSIHYSLVLHFYNGHECSREGTASYKKSEKFVDAVKDDADDGMCYFEIIPTKTGVRMNDPNGVCKMQSCGMRGGYNGAGFTFAQKVKMAAR